MMAHKPPNTRTSVDTYDLPNTINCVQGNLGRSHQAQLNLFIDIVNKNVYKNGIDVIFITEPYNVSKSNSLLDVPDAMSSTSSLSEGAGRH